MAGSSTASVVAGISANSLVSIAKLIGFAYSGSGAMLSEAIHSIADTTNQALLLLGLKQSEREADAAHPEGYGRERFFWGLVSALGIFFLGAGVTLYHGVHALLHPEPSTHGAVTWVVLTFAVVLEGGALAVAVRGLYKDAAKAGITPMRYFKEGRDPTLSAILAEDAAAVLGLLMAIAGIALEQATGSPIWDAAATLSIGILLALVAIFLIRANRTFLLTKAVDNVSQAAIEDVLSERGAVEEVKRLQAVITAMGEYRVSAELDFDGKVLAQRVLDTKDPDALAEALSDDEQRMPWLEGFAEEVVEVLNQEIDAVEREIRARVPEATQIDLETD